LLTLVEKNLHLCQPFYIYIEREREASCVSYANIPLKKKFRKMEIMALDLH